MLVGGTACGGTLPTRGAPVQRLLTGAEKAGSNRILPICATLLVIPFSLSHGHFHIVFLHTVFNRNDAAVNRFSVYGHALNALLDI